MWNPHTLTPSTILSVGNLLSFVFIFTAWSWYCCQFPPNRRRIKIKERSSSPCTAQTGTRIEAENSGRSKTNRYEISRTGNIFFYAGLRSRENSLDIQAKLGLTKNLTTIETIARLNKTNLGRRIIFTITSWVKGTLCYWSRCNVENLISWLSVQCFAFAYPAGKFAKK